ncbi:hypothetical protein OTU49_005124 [Cherax quadricarinatus]|uniref:Fasciculation and elongation protein zeta-2 n=1 Tax=Cherax quadricarinatus TaxID=27406 RepID=A0AAW0WV20_CHEQU
MGSRRVTGSLAAPQHRYAKMDHERRNHELLKRLASDIPAAKTARGVLGVPTSRSLTEQEKGLQGEATHVQDQLGKTRHWKKRNIDSSFKSFQRQTSSSAMKATNGVRDILEDKMGRELELNTVKSKRDRSPAKSIRKRESSPTRSMNAGNKNDKRSSQYASENTRRPDVFERLSKIDSNKSSSIVKSSRSLQEKNSCRDKHQSGRKPSVSSVSIKTIHRREGDRIPLTEDETCRREINVCSSSMDGGQRDDYGEDEDSSTEKQEQDNIPETVDKDRDDPPVSIHERLATMPPLTKSSSGSEALYIPGECVGENTCHPRVSPQQSQSKSLKQDSLLSQAKMDGHGTESNTYKSSEHLASHADEKYDTNNSYNKREHNLHPQTSNKCSGKDGARKQSSREEIISPRKGARHEWSTQPSNTRITPKTRDERVTAAVPSTSEIIQKMRERVSDGRVQDRGEAVVDDDKDVCEADMGEEEREFYKISVQTRLVSYNNSTLVIKNTSKSESVSENAASSDTETDSLCDPTTPTPTPTTTVPTLQSSSAGPAAVADMVDDAAAHALLHLTEAHQDEPVSEDLTRTRSVRRKLAHFMSKGKSLLYEVYSATQTKLEQYTRAESLSSSTSSLDTTEHQLDSDSGYYSIPPPLVETNPIWVEDHVHRATSWLREHGCYPLIPRAEPDDAHWSSTQESFLPPRPGMMPSTAGETHLGGSQQVHQSQGMGDETDLSEEDSELAGIKVDEQWIKKNILCTCKCRYRAIDDQQIIYNSQPDNSNTQITSATNTTAGDTKTQLQSATETTLECISNILETSPGEVGSEECGLSVRATSSRESLSIAGESVCGESVMEDEMCYCSCHEEEEGHLPPHLPQEVQELLDADHARMWWTITGNFGNILPIDWSKTYTRQQYLPVLNLNEIKDVPGGTTKETDGGTEENADEEEEVAQDLDLHHLILNGLTADPVKSAEEVIQEIDDIMQEGSSSEDEGLEESSSSGENTQEPISRPFPAPLYAEKLKNMSVGELNESLMELELVIRQYSETLINQLALRDELEYEKELKNSFISLLLQVQNKRRNFNVEKKRQKKYLTTVIPYDVGHGPPHNPTLQILIKILMAINEDSPTVPTLLTDYILKGQCGLFKMVVQY